MTDEKMTDEELKALVAGLATAQDRTDAQMAKTDAKIDRLSDKIEELADQIAKTDVLVKETSADIKKLGKMYGGASNNMGAAVEEFFYNSLKAHPVLGGVRFESVDRNVPGEDGDLKNEFDLLLVNGREVFVVEVKYKAHKDDLKHLLDVKAPNFRRMFPKYAGLRHRFGLATFHIHDELKELALKQGVTVLQRKGDVIETSPA